jgi:hypothetical protein
MVFEGRCARNGQESSEDIPGTHRLIRNGIPPPLLPKRPLRWKGIPLFHVGAFPEDFSGRLYFVLGQGLGDHVNGFRILVELQRKFPKATCIVYADLRWEELVRRLEKIEVRWYPKARDVLSKTGTNNPYDPANAEVRKEIRSMPGQAFLAHAHFPLPDRHARQETTLEATAWAIGLSLGRNPRPYLPVLPSDLEWAEEYLKGKGLNKGQYALIAPFSWPNKIWSKENFSMLIDRLHQSYGMRTIVASYPEIGSFENEGVLCAFDLSLGQLAGLIGSSGLYVGLDSGPSHMAAFFDLPMVVIFMETRVIPFEVRPLSPHSALVVESFFDQIPAPKVLTVLDAIHFLRNGRASERIPMCPVCMGSMNYVVASKDSILRLMCACGVAMDMDRDRDYSIPPKEISENKLPIMVDAKSFVVDQDLGNLADLEAAKSFIEKFNPVKMEVLLEKNLVGTQIPLVPGRLILGIDGLLFWMSLNGFILMETHHGSDGVRLFFLRVKNPTKSSKKEYHVVALPWGSGKIVTTGDRYLRWYSFARWAEPKVLVGIVKSLSELEFSRTERFACAWVAFRVERTMRSFRWVIKCLL